MSKIYIVCRSANDSLPYDMVAAFADEGQAYKSAEGHKTTNVKTWVEEINYYE